MYAEKQDQRIQHLTDLRELALTAKRKASGHADQLRQQNQQLAKQREDALKAKCTATIQAKELRQRNDSGDNRVPNSSFPATPFPKWESPERTVQRPIGTLNQRMANELRLETPSRSGPAAPALSSDYDSYNDQGTSLGLGEDAEGSDGSDTPQSKANSHRIVRGVHAEHYAKAPRLQNGYVANARKRRAISPAPARRRSPSINEPDLEAATAPVFADDGDLGTLDSMTASTRQASPVPARPRTRRQMPNSKGPPSTTARPHVPAPIGTRKRKQSLEAREISPATVPAAAHALGVAKTRGQTAEAGNLQGDELAATASSHTRAPCQPAKESEKPSKLAAPRKKKGRVRKAVYKP